MITLAQLREALREAPFRPFTVRSADGREYRIPHPEFVALHPRGTRTVVLFSDGGGCAIVDPFMLVSINYADDPSDGDEHPPGRGDADHPANGNRPMEGP